LTPEKKYVLGWKPCDHDDSMIFNVHSYNDGEYFGLQSNRWNNFVYVGVPNLDSDRRLVLMYNESNPEEDSSFRWKIENHGEYWSI
jgi:hypothetical protein